MLIPQRVIVSIETLVALQAQEHNMKVGAKGLKMSSGKVKHFASSKKRDNFERVAQAYKHGWKPGAKKSGRRK